MPPRVATRPAREIDFSNVGKVGRRTGVTLPQGPLDDNGMEEISGIFSSPRKSSPLKQSMSAVDAVEDRPMGPQSILEDFGLVASFTDTNLLEAGDEITPSQRRSARKALPPPRSASPRKSGISGTAKRSKTVDVLGQNRDSRLASSDQVDPENQTVPTPKLLSTGPKRFSPEKSPLRDVTNSRSQSVRSIRHHEPHVNNSIQNSIEISDQRTLGLEEPATVAEINLESNDQRPLQSNLVADDYVIPAIGDDDQLSVPASRDDDYEEPPLPVAFDDEEADQTFEPEGRSHPRSREPTIANSRKKRKSDVLELQTEMEAISSPAAKKAKRISDQTSKSNQANSPKESPAEPTQPKRRGRPPLKNKNSNLKLSGAQQEELNRIIEKVKPRPGQKKSLHLLRRETPADDTVTHTRSGRISFKPLHWWRNEKCIYGDSPGGASLEDGARFPLNSIKEIHRVQEVADTTSKKSKKAKRAKSKSVPRGQSGAPAEVEESFQEESESESESESEDEEDLNAEPWETERGIYRGQIAVWDQQQQSHVDDEEEEMDLAYAPASIEMREVKDATFRYAKMLSLKFFGSGIVDLPPKSMKKAKNSRRMHMSFFVAEGRVTVRIGPLGGTENKFSIGRGGWWQVPRGNQYSIENELENPAKVFFSQACELVPQSDDD